jgi:hypothetical protein
VLAAQGHEGNVAWLKRQLREVQDTIVKLQETQRFSEEIHTKHSRECEAAEKEDLVHLSPTHKKNKFSKCLSLCLRT